MISDWELYFCAFHLFVQRDILTTSIYTFKKKLSFNDISNLDFYYFFSSVLPSDMSHKNLMYAQWRRLFHGDLSFFLIYITSSISIIFQFT